MSQETYLKYLLLMHDHGCTTYGEFMDLAMAQWYDRCIRVDHALIVGRALWGWGFR